MPPGDEAQADNDCYLTGVYPRVFFELFRVDIVGVAITVHLHRGSYRKSPSL